MSLKDNELVMVVPTDTLFEEHVLTFSGMIESGDWTAALMKNIEKYASYQFRGQCENNPNFKQIIPYCFITVGDLFFVYKRLSGGGEARLHDLASIGIGGHINPENGAMSISQTITNNLLREIQEEVILGISLSNFSMPKFVGMINDDSNDVGKVHFGLVYHVKLPPFTALCTREKDVLAGEKMSEGQVAAIEKWENWSKLVLNKIL